MRDDFPRVKVGVLDDGLGHADLWVGQHCRQPLHVDGDAVPDRLVVGERQGEAVADHLGIKQMHHSAAVPRHSRPSYFPMSFGF